MYSAILYKEQVWNYKEQEKGEDRKKLPSWPATKLAWKKREKRGKWLPVAVCMALIVPFNVVSIF